MTTRRLLGELRATPRDLERLARWFRLRGTQTWEKHMDCWAYPDHEIWTSRWVRVR